MEKPKFYITTAIAYTSRKPHIGNTYDIVLADLIARYRRMQGFDVLFQTGSDEHGQKIEEYAEKAGITPKTYVDGVSAQIKSVWDCMNVTYDRFIRTTDADHERVVQKIFKKNSSQTQNVSLEKQSQIQQYVFSILKNLRKSHTQTEFH